MRNKMTLLLLCLLVAIAGCQTTQKGKGSDKIKDGPGKMYWPVKLKGETPSKKGEGNFKNYQPEGQWTLYYMGSGEKLAEGMYKNGKQEGRWVFYHKNGQKMTEGVFEEDQKKGEWVSYHDTGQLLSKANYIITEIEIMKGMKQKVGGIEGNVKVLFKSGKIHKDENWKKGKLDGKYREYFEDGRLKEFSDYTKGELDGKMNRWWPNGKRKEQGQYRKGKKVGQWSTFHINNAPASKGKYKDGMMVGKWQFYSKENLLQKEGKYGIKTVEKKVMNKEEGLWTFYRYTGRKREKAMELSLNAGMVEKENKSRLYEKGKLIGEGQLVGVPKGLYDIIKDGKVAGKLDSMDVPGEDPKSNITYKWTGDWVVPKRNGTWKEFYPGGKKVKFETVYLMNKKSGPYKEYYPNGKIKAEGSYQSDKMNDSWKFYDKSGNLDKEKSGKYMLGKKSRF